MPTKYDVFAEIIERAPCAVKDLPFTTPVYAHLLALIQDGLVIKKGTTYTPQNTPHSRTAFEIIKYCLNNGLDYNLFFSKNMAMIVEALFASAPVLRPVKLQANKDFSELLLFLEIHQFVLLTKRKPRTGIILKHQLLNRALTLHNKKETKKQTQYIPVQQELSTLRTEPTNPFDENVFAFLAGSAQLEGSTVTIGETRELILRDIYPEKPKKEVQMVKNLNEAVHYILDHLSETITPQTIQELNKLVLFSLHRSAGQYKKTQNKIQGNPNFKTAHPQVVPLLMEQYCQFLQKITSKEQCLEELGKIHNELQNIHPFADGNSRTTRMVVNWMLLKHELPLLVLKMGCFDAYMSLTKLATKRDDTQLKLLLQQILYHEQLTNK